jgi:hypothetical protein
MRLNAKSKADKRQTSTQPLPASREAKSANTSEQAAKSKLDKRQTSAQPPPAPTEAKSANTPEQSPTEVFFEIMQSLRRQELSEKEYAQVLIMHLFTRIYNLYGRIDEAFKNQPFNLAWLPDVKPNQQRLTALDLPHACIDCPVANLSGHNCANTKGSHLVHFAKRTH